ncbi:MAG: cytochrome c oxidase accessory protein CcoG [Deltaproteobacteria bacterium]|nr:cytochrome c oxidase accessory protein CcoG [Deltaproteobacteria bacterium]
MRAVSGPVPVARAEASGGPTQGAPTTKGLPPQAAQPVLSTLNQDGSRRALRPRLAEGRYYRARLVLAWALIALFTVLPVIHVHGRPLVLLDLPRRQFFLFGSTFLPSDTALLMLLLLIVVVTIFLLTALFGRVWCGWACPQTVYLEFVYRPIERLFEGSRPERQKRPGLRRAAKLGVFALYSVVVGNVFLAYFVGAKTLWQWMQRSPFEHPSAFLIMAGTSALMFFDFAWFREQMCILVCPYGRLQSVLLDRSSLIVGYDAARGEPRGKAGSRAARAQGGGEGRGDCVDCRACVAVCPTGIDIRGGLQMECIGCTQCIDACDAIMERVGRPKGLIRYSSQEGLAGKPGRLLRPRVVAYPLILVVLVGLFGLALSAKQPAEVTVLRTTGAPFAEVGANEISNPVRVKILNRTDRAQRYRLALQGAKDLQLVAPQNPVPVEAGQSAVATFFVLSPRAAFVGGERPVAIVVSDDRGFRKELTHRLLGPGR